MEKLIFFDIDGTLAIHRNIPAENRQALKQLLANKEKTFICTGRPPFYARALFGHLVYGIICCNGGCICTKDELLYTRPLGIERIGYLCRKAQQYDFGLLFADENYVYPYGLSEQEIEDLEQSYGGNRIIRDFDPETTPVYVFDLFYRDKARFQQICQLFDGILIINDHGGLGHADCSFVDTTKGTAIAWLQDKEGISRQDSYAFGDGTNDVAMFEACDHRICMANGVDELKEKATYITGAVDDHGIVQGLKHEKLLD